MEEETTLLIANRYDLLDLGFRDYIEAFGLLHDYERSKKYLLVGKLILARQLWQYLYLLSMI